MLQRSNFVTLVPDSFWARFFSHPLTIRVVGSAVCCSLQSDTDHFVLVYPELPEDFVPGVELFQRFPRGEEGFDYSEIEKLPFAYVHLKNAAGVKFYSLSQKGRHLTCIIPTWEADAELFFSDHNLLFLELKADCDDVYRISENHVVLWCRHEPEIHHWSIIALVRNDKLVPLTSNGVCVRIDSHAGKILLRSDYQSLH